MINRGNVGGGAPVQFVNRLYVTLHVPRLVLVTRSECPGHRIEVNQDALEAEFLFETLDGCGKRLGIDQSGC